MRILFQRSFCRRLIRIRSSGILHRIEGLSEHFLYFNDDVFLLNKVKPTHFFKHGKPVDMLSSAARCVANKDNEVMSYIYLNNAILLAKHFDKYENMEKQAGSFFHVGYPLKYYCYNVMEMAFPRFTGFYTVHGPSPLKKSTYETLWQAEPELLRKVLQPSVSSQGGCQPVCDPRMAEAQR